MITYFITLNGFLGVELPGVNSLFESGPRKHQSESRKVRQNGRKPKACMLLSALLGKLGLHSLGISEQGMCLGVILPEE